MNGQRHTVYRIGQQHAAWREAGDEIVVLDTRNSVYFGLDRSAALLWRRLLDGATADELTEALAATAPVERERAADDVTRFLSELDGHGLLQRS
ncbi:PqqD family protein [Micromonospora mirobrigensis]|uniref:Coenzyme PQQ synthesis protein D (PqqD) n=1 Tax=Micromonospora mirobrigensis TaxID=262898 RepID=A0A1C4Z4K0_9ACTN|nr:PqqD family protein [Micromonospora mirobrigensis]SCF27939.1 Coenzyme PQQ synthesis protein D (PqqD) [Micromonospora mirobrigensis]